MRDLPPDAVNVYNRDSTAGAAMGVVQGTPGGQLDADALEQIARVLTASGEYRVIRRFRPRARYYAVGEALTATALFVDVETTGLNMHTDRMIEFAAVPFTYRKDTGHVCGLGVPLVALEDPGCPIPAAVTALTGIRDDMVRGRRADDSAVEALLATAQLVIAHNAAFDRKVLEHRFPAFRQAYWACSRDDVPWAEYGVRGTKLDYLLLERCAEFFDGHRAEADCQAAIHLLATPLPCGTLPFQLLLASARRGCVRVWAVGAPFAVKELLKGRGYRWSGDDGVHPKTWFRDCPTVGDANHECAWLAARAYVRTAARPVRQHLTARDRYSIRS